MGTNSPKDVIGKTPYEYYPKELADSIIKHVKKIVELKIPLSQEDLIRDIITGQLRYYEATRSPVFNSKSDVIAVVGTSIEIIDKKEKEQLLLEKQQHEQQQQNKLKATIEQVAHDIRSPIATLKIILSLCETYPAHFKSMLNNSADKIQDIANSLAIRFNAKKITFVKAKPSLVLMSSVILETVAQKRYDYIDDDNNYDNDDECEKYTHDHSKVQDDNQVGPGLRIDYEIDNYLTFVKLDVGALKRMLSNLVNNAVEAQA